MINEGRKNTILLCGFQRTGNIWTRFILANYFNILNFNATKSLSKKTSQLIFHHYIKKEIENKQPLTFKRGFPAVYHIYGSMCKTKEIEKFCEQFDKHIYIYRNPFDVMISLFYAREIPKNPSYDNFIKKYGLKELDAFDNFVKKKISFYIRHVKENKHKADLVLDYDKLRKDLSDFKKMLSFLVNKVDEKIFKKTIEMSSFKNAHKLEIESEQYKKEILTKKYVPLKTRNGKSGQYKTEMKKELIEYIKKEWKKANLEL